MGLGYGSSSQNSVSYSGLRGTPGFGNFADNYATLGSQATSLASKYAKSPFGYFQGQNVNTLAPVNQYGLAPETTGALNSVASQEFAKASAGGAMNGMVSPENTAGIVGSSLNNIGQFLTPYIMDYAKYRQQLPEQLMSSRLGFLQNTLGSMGAGLGSQSAYQGSSMNFDTGLSANFGPK